MEQQIYPKNTKSLKTIAFLTNWMDTKFTIPFTSIKFGIDPILSLIPGFGDVLSTSINIGIYALILTKGVPVSIALKMMFNIVIDTLISSIPFIGTIFDVGFKANARNLTLLETHLKNNPSGDYKYGIWVVFSVGIILVLVILVLLIALIVRLLTSLLG